jgi:hypothetical protein
MEGAVMLLMVYFPRACVIPFLTLLPPYAFHQAEKFLVNVPSKVSSGFVSMGGHGGDGNLECKDAATGVTLVSGDVVLRCCVVV